MINLGYRAWIRREDVELMIKNPPAIMDGSVSLTIKRRNYDDLIVRGDDLDQIADSIASGHAYISGITSVEVYHSPF